MEAALLEAIGPGPVGALPGIGTGTGRIPELAADRIEQGVGIDPSHEMLEIARVRLSGALPPWPRPLLLRLPCLPESGGSGTLPAPVGAEAIGIRLGEEAQLDPGLSTSALVLRRPRARYFAIQRWRRAPRRCTMRAEPRPAGRQASRGGRRCCAASK